VRAEEAVKQGEVEREELGSERSSVRTVTEREWVGKEGGFSSRPSTSHIRVSIPQQQERTAPAPLAHECQHGI
jgi:hypothetical protein